MAERMTTDEFRRKLSDLEQVSPFRAMLVAATEAGRARDAEEMLLADVAAKDTIIRDLRAQVQGVSSVNRDNAFAQQEDAAKIKALADALYGTGYVDHDEWHTEACHELREHGMRCSAAVAALRLSGRLS